MANKKIKLDFRKDGTYIIVDNSDPNDKVSRKELLETIEEQNLKQVDFSVVSEILKAEDVKVEKKISNEVAAHIVPEDIDITISKDKLKAIMKFLPPESGGPLLTTEEILIKLQIQGIKFGVKTETIIEAVALADLKVYGKEYIVAEGKTPVNGDDGAIIHNYDISGEKSQPTILGDGSVDYKQINYFLPVKAGQVLAYRTEASAGEAGTDIFDNVMVQKSGKPAPKLTRGKNTIISEDGMELIAERSGQLVITGKTMSISPVLDIKGDVDFSTGNIDFDGSVNVNGSVLSGFSVIAEGNVEVKGIVEAATIVAQGAVNLYGGIMGRSKGRIESGGSIFTKFAQNATLIAKGNLKSNALLHSNVTVDGSIILEGDNCFIAGGTILAGDEVRAKTIGSHMGTRTEIVVGQNSELTTRAEEMQANYEVVKEQFVKLNESYEAIIKAGDVASMDARRKAMLVQLLQSRNALRERAQSMEEELSEVMALLRKSTGKIIAETIMYAGSHITVGSAQKQLNDDITVSIFTSVDGIITAKPYMG